MRWRKWRGLTSRVATIAVLILWHGPKVNAAEAVTSTTVATAGDASVPSPYWLDEVRNCGPKCLHFLEGLFGGGSAYLDVCTLAPPTRDGTTIQELAEAAKDLSFSVTPFSGSVGQLAHLQQPAILFLESAPIPDANEILSENHYIVLLGYNPQTAEYLIFDPPRDVRKVDYKYLVDRFDGLGLLVGKDAAPALNEALSRTAHWRPLILFVGVVGGWTVACRFRSQPRLAKRLPAGVGSAAFFGCFIVTGCGTLTEKSRKADLPVEEPREFNAGVLLQGEKLSHNFQVFNGSDKPFRIVAVDASCDCTSVLLDEEVDELKPGQETWLKVEFDSTHEQGFQRKTMKVETDSEDPLWRTISYTLAVNVLQPVTSIPQIVHLGAVSRHGSTSKVITLEINDSRLYGATSTIQCLLANVEAVALPVKSDRLGKYQIHLRDAQTSGPLHTQIAFKYRKDDMEFTLHVPVQADVKGTLDCLPRKISASAIELAVGKRQRILIRAPEGPAFRIIDIKTPEGVTVEGDWRSLGPAEKQELFLVIDFKQLVGKDEQVIVVTDLAEDENVRIPLVAPGAEAENS